MRNITNDAEQQQTPEPEQSVLKSINWISLLVALIIATGMIVDGKSVTTSVLGGVSFYGVIAGLVILTPHVANIITTRMKEVTIRRRDELPYRPQPQQVTLVQPPQLARREPALPMQPALPQTPNYVPAVPRTTRNAKVDAANFAAQLFSETDGKPTHITKNTSQIQWKYPSAEAIEYLASLGIVWSKGNQLYWNIKDYPTYNDAYYAIRTGVKPPYLEEGEGRVEGGG